MSERCLSVRFSWLIFLNCCIKKIMMSRETTHLVCTPGCMVTFTEIRNYERDLVIGNDKCTAFGRCVGIFGLPSGDVQEAIWSSEVKKAGNWETWGCYRFDCILPKVC